MFQTIKKFWRIPRMLEKIMSQLQDLSALAQSLSDKVTSFNSGIDTLTEAINAEKARVDEAIAQLSHDGFKLSNLDPVIAQLQGISANMDAIGGKLASAKTSVDAELPAPPPAPPVVEPPVPAPAPSAPAEPPVDPPAQGETASSGQ